MVNRSAATQMSVKMPMPQRHAREAATRRLCGAEREARTAQGARTGPRRGPAHALRSAEPARRGFTGRCVGPRSGEIHALSANVDLNGPRALELVPGAVRLTRSAPQSLRVAASRGAV